MQKVLIIIGDASETLDTMYPYYRLQEAGFLPVVAAPEKRRYQMVMHEVKAGWTITKEWEGYTIEAATAFKDVDPEDYAGIMFSGGRAPEYIRYDQDLVRITRHFFDAGKPIASVCHGVEIPAYADCVRGRRMATVPKCRFDLEVCGGVFVDEGCVIDDNLFSGRTFHDNGQYVGPWIEMLVQRRAAARLPSRRRFERLRDPGSGNLYRRPERKYCIGAAPLSRAALFSTSTFIITDDPYWFPQKLLFCGRGRRLRSKTQSMICVSVGRTRHKHTIAEHQFLADQGVQLVELRLDFIGRSVNLSRLLDKRPCPVVVTCRRREDGGRWQRSEEERLMLLRGAIAMGVEYVDLEADVAATVPRYGKTKRIVSHHDFIHTPDNLAELHRHLAAQEADIVKIATMANTIDDTLRMMDLARTAKIPTIAICMGDIGTPTRILAGRLGAPFTYATYSSDRKLAPGQLNWRVMQEQYRYDSITPETQLFGVIADPVAHSHSPVIHNAAFAHQEVDARYLPFRVPAEDLETFVDACPELGIRGLSVTIPHKEAALDLMSRAEAAATGIGAINTVLFDGDERLGYNTDYRAAMECLLEAMGCSEGDEQPLQGKTALVLGAGGAARAVGWGLHQKAAKVIFTSRTPERAESLASDIGGSTVPWADRHDPRVDLLVNATPVGMHPDLDSTPFRGDLINPDCIVFETIYNPERTLLIKDARAAGCQTITGVEMFVRQAAYQYRLFTDRQPPIELMREVLKTATNPVRLSGQGSGAGASE